MEEKPALTKIDEDFIRKSAAKITEEDIRHVDEHAEEIKSRVLGKGPLGTFVEELLLTLGLVKDYITGAYRKIPYWAIAAVAFMFLYIANPMDMIPDFIIGIGQLDDVAVVSICLILVRQEIYAYRAWKAEREPDDA